MSTEEWTSINKLSEEVIGAAIEVHRELGPGLLERTYRRCLAWELEHRGLDVGEEVRVPVRYKQAEIADTYRLDLLVEDTIIVELKRVSHVLPVHRAQLLTYLRAARRPLGLLLNFHEARLVDGVHRLAN